MTRMMPGPALDQAVFEKMKEYDAWEISQRSKGCRDRDGVQLMKPPPLLGGHIGTGVAAERWLEMWTQLVLKHKRVCVQCGGAENVNDGRPETLQAQDSPAEATG